MTDEHKTEDITEEIPEEIKVLTFPDVVRKRPKMYVGEIDNNDAVAYMFSVVLDHAVYLAAQSSDRLIKVSSVYPKIQMTYSGEGFPFDEIAEETFSHGERYLERFYAGPEEEKWTTPGDPLGLCIINAVSEFFKVSSWRKNKLWACEYRKGLQTLKPHIIQEGIGDETTIEFTPDVSILENYTNLKKRFDGLFKDKAQNHPEISFEFLGSSIRSN